MLACLHCLLVSDTNRQCRHGGWIDVANSWLTSTIRTEWGIAATKQICLFVVLWPSNIYGYIRMGTDLGQRTLMVNL